MILFSPFFVYSHWKDETSSLNTELILSRMVLIALRLYCIFGRNTGSNWEVINGLNIMSHSDRIILGLLVPIIIKIGTRNR